MKATELFCKLKPFLKIADFGGHERMFLLTRKIMTYKYPGYTTKYRCANINGSTKVLLWNPKKEIGKVPTFEEFLKLYPEIEAHP